MSNLLIAVDVTEHYLAEDWSGPLSETQTQAILDYCHALPEAEGSALRNLSRNNSCEGGFELPPNDTSRAEGRAMGGLSSLHGAYYRGNTCRRQLRWADQQVMNCGSGSEKRWAMPMWNKLGWSRELARELGKAITAATGLKTYAIDGHWGGAIDWEIYDLKVALRDALGDRRHKGLKWSKNGTDEFHVEMPGFLFICHADGKAELSNYKTYCIHYQFPKDVDRAAKDIIAHAVQDDSGSSRIRHGLNEIECGV